MRLIHILLLTALISIDSIRSEAIGVSQKPFEIKKLVLNNEQIKILLENSFVVRDSVYADFNNDGFIDMALILEETTKHEQNDFIIPYQKKNLLIFLNRNNSCAELVVNLSELFEHPEFKDSNWGINGNDAFDEMQTENNDIILVFCTGGTTRFIEQFCFYLKSNEWQLKWYRKKEFDIMDVKILDNSGIIQNIYVEEYDFTKKNHLTYTKKVGNHTDSTSSILKSGTYLLTDFIAYECASKLEYFKYYYPIVSTSLNIRSDTSHKSPILTQVHLVDSLQVIEKEDEWYKVRINDQEGYAYSQYISPFRIPSNIIGDPQKVMNFLGLAYGKNGEDSNFSGNILSCYFRDSIRLAVSLPINMSVKQHFQFATLMNGYQISYPSSGEYEDDNYIVRNLSLLYDTEADPYWGSNVLGIYDKKNKRATYIQFNTNDDFYILEVYVSFNLGQWNERWYELVEF